MDFGVFIAKHSLHGRYSANVTCLVSLIACMSIQTSVILHLLWPLTVMMMILWDFYWISMHSSNMLFVAVPSKYHIYSTYHLIWFWRNFSNDRERDWSVRHFHIDKLTLAILYSPFLSQVTVTEAVLQREPLCRAFNTISSFPEKYLNEVAAILCTSKKRQSWEDWNVKPDSDCRKSQQQLIVTAALELLHYFIISQWLEEQAVSVCKGLTLLLKSWKDTFS